jgi:hypothetical protein
VVTVPQPTIMCADVQCSSGVLASESQYRKWLPLVIPVPKWPGTQYLRDVKENRRTAYRISEAARELGISAKWLRVGEKREYRGIRQRVYRSQWRLIRPYRNGRGVTEECELQSMRGRRSRRSRGEYKGLEFRH